MCFISIQSFKMGVYYCACLMVFCITANVHAEAQYSKCFLANRKHGLCLPIQKCKTLLETTAVEDVSLRSYQCGWGEFVGPLVCCEDTCVSNMGKLGTCKTLSQCPKIKKYIANNYLTKSVMGELRCGSSTEFMICCSDRILKDLIQTALAANTLPHNEMCGNQGVFNKILDGSVAGIDEFPWLARLEYLSNKGQYLGYGCGGVLISNRYVLTAAHCVTNYYDHGRQIYRVRLGEYNTTSSIDCVEIMGFRDCADIPKDIGIEQSIVHPYRHDHHNDIALLRLSESISYTDFIQPICLPTAYDTVSVGDILWVSGWGKTETDSYSNIKLKLKIPVVSLEDCNRKYKTQGLTLRSGHMCAGSEEGRDACFGDSGGPLMVSSSQTTTAQWKIMGIISMGNQCGLKGWPGIYTKVAPHLNWINNNIGS